MTNTPFTNFDQTPSYGILKEYLKIQENALKDISSKGSAEVMIRGIQLSMNAPIIGMLAAQVASESYQVEMYRAMNLQTPGGS